MFLLQISQKVGNLAEGWEMPNLFCLYWGYHLVPYCSQLWLLPEHQTRAKPTPPFTINLSPLYFWSLRLGSTGEINVLLQHWQSWDFWAMRKSDRSHTSNPGAQAAWPAEIKKLPLSPKDHKQWERAWKRNLADNSTAWAFSLPSTEKLHFGSQLCLLLWQKAFFDL